MRIHAVQLLTSRYGRMKSRARWAVCAIERPRRWLVRLVPQGRSAMQLLRAMLREIFDESAYERFLAQTNASSTSQAYAEFVREYGQRKARRVRCC